MEGGYRRVGRREDRMKGIEGSKPRLGYYTRPRALVLVIKEMVLQWKIVIKFVQPSGTREKDCRSTGPLTVCGSHSSYNEVIR